jgi:hypothetical protein
LGVWVSDAGDAKGDNAVVKDLDTSLIKTDPLVPGRVSRRSFTLGLGAALIAAPAIAATAEPIAKMVLDFPIVGDFVGVESDGRAPTYLGRVVRQAWVLTHDGGDRLYGITSIAVDADDDNFVETPLVAVLCREAWLMSSPRASSFWDARHDRHFL